MLLHDDNIEKLKIESCVATWKMKTREINEKLNKEELFNENSWNQETVTLLNLNNIQENECIVEKDHNGNSK